MVAVSASWKVGRLADFLLGVAALGLVSCGQTRSAGTQQPDDARGGSTGSGGVSDRGGSSPRGGGGGANDAVFRYEPQGAPIYTRAQRLTNSQFEHAAIDLLKLPSGTDLKSQLVPPVAGVTRFSNDELVLTMDEASVLAFEEAAEKAAGLATP